MQKPAALRTVLETHIPELARDADRLRMFIKKGAIEGRGNHSRNFGYAYTLSIEIYEFTGHPSVPVLLINDWLLVNQPDRLQPGKQAYAFEAEILDSQTVDLFFDIDLTEVVVVTPRTGGGWNMQHPAEPDPLFPDDELIGGPLTDVWAGEAQVHGG